VTRFPRPASIMDPKGLGVHLPLVDHRNPWDSGAPQSSHRQISPERPADQEIRGSGNYVLR
jgi:hypothetical protein